MTYEELKAKYPEIHHAPREGCKYCGGTGEKVAHLKKSEFFEARDVTIPCICLFVDHEYVDEIQGALNETISRMKRGAS